MEKFLIDEVTEIIDYIDFGTEWDNLLYSVKMKWLKDRLSDYGVKVSNKECRKLINNYIRQMKNEEEY